ncbi:LapA family protein [Nonomuraea africana]|uniref:Integral membrane protein n=1 Tax=Nonomuraea africana TaxID=46171 RepID=A0ABR9KK73_9ACTN|nr:lipopolysaccharide assembly protein LapA domain-containing protein [Nonomuraea africana]MBE1561942.1 putative integral membrane protein [Nonomuraea africana]
MRRTRIGGWWVALIAGAIVLLLLLVFVLQNGQLVQISFLGWQGVLPLGVALLLAAIGGIMAVAIPGTGRILQLRQAAHHRAAQTPAAPRRLAPPKETVNPPTRSAADEDPRTP